MDIIWHDKAWAEYLDWQSTDSKTLRKINRLLRDIQRNGYRCMGKPEPLTGDLTGFWSVRIDQKNRIVFRIRDGNLISGNAVPITIITEPIFYSSTNSH